MHSFEKTDYLYTTLFCEENIWQLANSLIDKNINEQDIKIIFITNKDNRIAFFNQQAASHDQPVIWDYHVILLAKINNTVQVFDFDSRLPFPCDIKRYLSSSLPGIINKEYMSQFRIIPARLYLTQFYSDRSHMQGVIPDDKFPHYPPICSPNIEHINLYDLFNINKKIHGTLVVETTQQLISWAATQ